MVESGTADQPCHTLLRLIAGLEQPEEGRILFNGEDNTNRDVRERRVGFVFQHYALFRHMNIFDNIAFGLTVRTRKTRPSKEEIKEKVHSLLKLVQLEGLAHRYPSQLSGGQRQRVALARALAVEPKFLLLDEPFGALDTKVRQELRRWLRHLHGKLGLTILFVTHDQEEAMELADQVVVMNEGRVEQVGSPEEIYHHLGMAGWFLDPPGPETNAVQKVYRELAVLIQAAGTDRWMEVRQKLVNTLRSAEETLIAGKNPWHLD